ncbi:GyrI-like domain-containing protein [Rhodococcus triatomae]|uniref:Effector-binding domain-containing protein n=1 Tax=Rhodococcus triatomae TaxID=300028 RepID=A0A1G8FAZ4_9NOCA|nr:GyrI-like domain-containing protein [Rhodococcus triatomae]QNG19433.1 GyrI-like domain-containing protein [Rhodococcus triatomae]QNG24653.1 GyrI-like domain-containing protein [Rhodococcus triatomae]SDH79139.1 effector-binding domain-containing protein [Rhodococcus triatomae]
MTASGEPELVTVGATTTAVVHGLVPMTEITNFYDSAFRALDRVLTGQSITLAGAGFGLYHGVPTDTADIEVGFPADRPVVPAGDVVASELPAGRVARLVHRGAFDGLGESWQRLGRWIEEQGLVAGPVMWEVYLTEPSPDMDPEELRTELNWVVTDPM